MPRPIYSDNKKFQIKTKMAGNRALIMTEHIGAHQFRLRIRNNDPGNTKQWFVFDSRTQTIRPITNRKYVIANQLGQRFIRGRAAVVRPYRAHIYVKIGYYKGNRRNIRNAIGLCLDVWGGRNVNNQHLTWWTCHNGLNQAFALDKRGISYQRNPIKDGVRFQIKTRMATNRAIFWREDIGGQQFRLRIRDNNPKDMKQFWVFDSRTKTIRAFLKRTHVIANQVAKGFAIGKAAVVLKYTGKNVEKISFHTG